jgi:hypothetical protein
MLLRIEVPTGWRSSHPVHRLLLPAAAPALRVDAQALLYGNGGCCDHELLGRVAARQTQTGIQLFH